MIIKGKLTHIYICPVKGEIMVPVFSARALQGKGLEGDRYTTGNGSWNMGRSGKRQITLINLDSFHGTGFEPVDSRRNLVVQGCELMRLINEKFTIGTVIFQGVKYCYPCNTIDHYSGKKGFAEKFLERGGLIADICTDGEIKVGDPVTLMEEP